ncbi:MAG: hypothetical protein AAGJ35_16245, partial [Myxococcota bacterium]
MNRRSLRLFALCVVLIPGSMLSGCFCALDYCEYYPADPYCSGGRRGPSQSRTQTDEECYRDAHCVQGLACVRRQCVPFQDAPSECRRDSHCTNGEACVYNSCRPRCRVADDCNLGRPCDCLKGVCYPRTDTTPPKKNPPQVECKAHTDCSSGKVCLASKCEDGCRNDSECPRGQLCGEHQCRKGCKSDNDCSKDELCFQGGCKSNVCRSDADCKVGSICKTSGSSCVAGCRRDGDCKTGQVCQKNVCKNPVPTCETDKEC